MNKSQSSDEPSILQRISNVFSKKESTPRLSGVKPLAADERREIASHMVEVSNLDASDVAVPRADIIAIEVTAPVAEITKILSDYPHSYYPVYRTTLDNLIGFFAARDLIKSIESVDTFVLREHVREAMVVAPSTSVLDVLHKMRLRGQRIALIADEYGGVDGIITAEDIVEKVIGRLEENEREIADTVLQENEDGSVLVSARVTLEEFEDRYGALFTPTLKKDEDIDTLGGLIFFLAGHIPARNEIVKHPSGVEFQIVDCNVRFIKTLIVRNIPAA
ncbi:MAG: CBS domain-containing protein [Alphaproteobacteria bacterium]|nr:CBS domain-containing protein [Alphaproteobacteria bacterium]